MSTRLFPIREKETELAAYLATVRCFLDVSRAYLAIRDSAGLELKHSREGRGYLSGMFALPSSGGRRHPFSPLQKQR